MPQPIEREEIVTRRERRRRGSAQGKVRLLEETVQPGITLSPVARLHGGSQPAVRMRMRSPREFIA